MPPLQSIDEVIAALGNIILESKKNKDTSGYFAALYRNVTIRVKEGIAGNKFENGPRMEKLDIVFASRYLDAYQAWKNKQPVSASWMKAFNISTHYWPIVLQHLLMGMNAHITSTWASPPPRFQKMRILMLCITTLTPSIPYWPRWSMMYR